MVVVCAGVSCGAVLGASGARGAALLGAVEGWAVADGVAVALGGIVQLGAVPVCTAGVGSKRTQP